MKTKNPHLVHELKEELPEICTEHCCIEDTEVYFLISCTAVHWIQLPHGPLWSTQQQRRDICTSAVIALHWGAMILSLKPDIERKRII